MDIAAIETVLRQGTETAKVRALHDAFFAKRRQVEPKDISARLLLDQIATKNDDLRTLAILYLGSREWADNDGIFAAFSRIALNHRENVETRKNVIDFICIRHPSFADLSRNLLADKSHVIRQTLASNLHRLQVRRGNLHEVRSLYLRALRAYPNNPVAR